ncbi:hypothetical protein MHM582_1500 [Microbacterium sp. HM58-2]|nr:hypothetical protein MHM582_1500 [Microbacterium sp. HM58-2]
MLEHLRSGSVLASIMMSEPPPPLVLLIEGPDDDALLGGHLAPGVISIVCGGRKTVIDAVKGAEEVGWTHVLGLVDRDLVPEIDGPESLPTGVVVTDAYDLTADVAAAKPGAIGQALTAHAYVEARRVTQARSEPIETSVLDLATRFAGVRIVVQRREHPVVLGGFDFRRVLDSEYRTLDASGFVDALRVTDTNFAFTEEMREEFADSIARSAGRRHLAGGHDIAAAAFGIATKAGARRFSKEGLERTIRAFAECAVLRTIACLVALQALAAERQSVPMFDCFSDAPA